MQVLMILKTIQLDNAKIFIAQSHSFQTSTLKNLLVKKLTVMNARKQLNLVDTYAI
jgi:hypothetical protein